MRIYIGYIHKNIVNNAWPLTLNWSGSPWEHSCSGTCPGLVHTLLSRVRLGTDRHARGRPLMWRQAGNFLNQSHLVWFGHKKTKSVTHRSEFLSIFLKNTSKENAKKRWIALNTAFKKVVKNLNWICIVHCELWKRNIPWFFSISSFTFNGI